MWRSKGLVAGAVALALAGLSGCGRHRSVGPASQAVADDAALGPGDVFEVRIFGDKELSGKYQVGPGGSVRFPFIGEIVIAGKEADRVADEIAQGLKQGNYLVDPQVSVNIEQANSKRISVIGAVSRPGMLAITPGMTVVHAVTNSGGFTPLASKDDTVVTRRVNGKLERFRVPVSEVTRGNAEDFPLRAGDIIFVPERVF